MRRDVRLEEENFTDNLSYSVERMQLNEFQRFRLVAEQLVFLIQIHPVT